MFVIVKWVNRVKLKQRNIWDIEAERGDSWSWKRFLGLRDKMKPFVWHELGNGLNTSIWFDKWDVKGPLSMFITSRDIYDARFSNDAKVADMVVDGRWIWPDDWWIKFPILNEIQVPKLSQSYDKVVWLDSDNIKSKFSIKGVWKSMRYEHPKVDWYKTVWFSQCVPRHAFIMWLALHNRLQTQERLGKWNNGVALECSLCSTTFDSVQHLFFQCQFTCIIWDSIKELVCLEKTNHNWHEILQDIQNKPLNNSIRSVLGRLGLATCVYNIWRERNLRLFQGSKRTVDEVIQNIKDDLR